MTDFLDFEIDNCGLGTTISLLSLFFHIGKPVILRAPENYKILREVKTVFDIPDEKLTIINQESIPNSITNRAQHCVSDYCKFWSPYFGVDKLCYTGQHVQTGKKHRPCIGLVTNNGWWVDELPSNSVPFNRYYKKDFWLKIYDLIMQAGYDVVGLNSTLQSLEQKVYMLNELCDAVIGSEGGICHLAHLLNVPSIIMPWHHHESGADPHEDGSLFYVPHKMHLDRRTYFVKSQEEILHWSPKDLCHQIDKLRLQQGNNVYFNSDYSIGQEHGIHVIKNYTVPEATQAQLTEWENEFIHTHLDNFNIGG